MKNKPRKPTEPFGHVAFSKNGSVTKKMQKLSGDKESQESEVIGYFLSGIKKALPELEIVSFEKLPEADQDFLLQTKVGPITIQLTEIVERDYLGDVDHGEFIQKEYGGKLWPVDTERRDSALVRAIEKKIKKNYSKSEDEKLWLIIFCTSPFLLTEYKEGGKARESKGLVAARKHIASITDCIFDEVWYTNLQTRPVKIWPVG